MVRDREFVRVADLSTMFGTSEVTIRSDLDVLAEMGRLQRVHGGAVVRDPAAGGERSFEEALGTAHEEKSAIGRYAASLIRSGETVILDVGTTTTAIARALVEREDLTDVVVFTSALTLALELEAAIPRISVVVTGGTLRPKQHSLVEPMAGYVLDKVNAATSFMGCNGVHVDAGVTNVNLPEAAMKRRIVASSQRCVVVADGSKIGNISVVKITDLDSVDLLITGASAPPEIIRDIEAQGIEVAVVT
jgi:DeoR family transcriptional regulator of aga operon